MSYLYLPIEIITRIQGIWDRGCVFENLLEPWKCTPPEFENNRKETNCLSPHRIEGLRSPTRWLHILSQPFSRCYSFLITPPPPALHLFLFPFPTQMSDLQIQTAPPLRFFPGVQHQQRSKDLTAARSRAAASASSSRWEPSSPLLPHLPKNPPLSFCSCHLRWRSGDGSIPAQGWGWGRDDFIPIGEGTGIGRGTYLALLPGPPLIVE
jgi:hypothetical protein